MRAATRRFAAVLGVVACLAASPVPAQSVPQGLFGTPSIQQLPLNPVVFEPLIADFNGDGIQDIARGSGAPMGIVCMLGPTYSVPISTPGGPSPLDFGVPLKAVDLNADGLLDIVAYGGNGIRNFLSNGNGTFFAVPPPAGVPWHDFSALDVADFDLDGNPDLAAVRSSTGPAKGALTIFRNQGGVWVAVMVIQTPFLSDDLSIGDVDGDGRDDIVVFGINAPASYGGTAAVYRNTGPGYLFQLQGNFAHGFCTMGRVGDVDGDGCADLVTALVSGADIGFARGTPSATLLPPQILHPPPFPYSNQGVDNTNLPVLRDFDGDGRKDVLMPLIPLSGWGPFVPVSHLAGCLFLCRGSTLSTTPMVLNFRPGRSRGSIGAGDLDADGDQDLVTATDQSFVNYGGPVDQGIVLNLSIFGRGLPGAAGVPGFSIGSAVPGNPSFSLRLDSARPNAVALLGLSTASGMIGTPAGAIWLELGPDALLSPSSTFGAFMTDALGGATVTFSLPSGAAVQGTSFFAQWAISDPAGQTLQGLGPLALSDARKIVLWP